MAQGSVNNTQWDLISHAVSAQRQQQRVQQQATFRVIAAIAEMDIPMLSRLEHAGINFDQPLLLKGPDSTPLPAHLLPTGYSLPYMTPMSWAAWRDDTDALQHLLENGADPLFPGPDGRDPAWVAALAGAGEAWFWFREKGLVWSSRTADGQRTTRLIDAVRARNRAAVADIVRHVDVAATDVTGRTALHYNFLQNPYTDADVNIARLLLEYGAPADAEDIEGVSPAALANTPDQQQMMEMLELAAVSENAALRASRQRDMLEAKAPTPMPEDPTDPLVPQRANPIKAPKRYL